MPPVVVMEQGSQLRIHRQRLQVAEGDEVLAELPLNHVSSVLLFGRVGLSTPAIGRLLREQIPVTFLSVRGEYRGELSGGISSRADVRRLQYLRCGDPAYRLAMARCFVNAKLENQRLMLQRQLAVGGMDQSDIDLLNQTVDALDRFQQTAAGAANPGALRGLEGSASRAYFAGYRALFDPSWGFRNRNRRPPRDPVNVLLSFGYTLLVRTVGSALETAGLDPYAGFLHGPASNRPGLALDVMEELRPVVDRMVLGLCRGGEITMEDFTLGGTKRPVVFSREAAGKFVQAYEERMAVERAYPGVEGRLPLQRCLVEHGRHLVRLMKESSIEYQGMLFR